MLSPVANYLILPVVNIVNGLIYHINFNIPKALLLGAIFHATPLRDKLHVPLRRVTCCAMLKIIAKQVASIVAQSRIGSYFLQRLQQRFSALHPVAPFQQVASQCFHNNECGRMRVIQCSRKKAFIEKKTCKRVPACNTPSPCKFNAAQIIIARQVA